MDADGKWEKHNPSSKTQCSYCKLDVTVPHVAYNPTDSGTTHIYICYEYNIFYLF